MYNYRVATLSYNRNELTRKTVFIPGTADLEPYELNTARTSAGKEYILRHLVNSRRHKSLDIRLRNWEIRKSYIGISLVVMMSVGTVRMTMRQFFGSCGAYIQDISFKMQFLPGHGMIQIDDHTILGN